MIDMARLEELRDDVGEEEFGEVLELFFLEVETAIDALPDAIDRAAALHFIKGCALNLGFNDLANACEAGLADAEILSCFETSRLRLAETPLLSAA